MTRIDPILKSLSDQHLRSNLREITRPFGKVLKRIEQGKDFKDIPSTYRLGAGHEKFFFNKLCWLLAQYDKLNDEHILRFGKPSSMYENTIEKVNSIADKIDKCYFKSWFPTEEELETWATYMVDKKIPELKGKITYYGKEIAKAEYKQLILNNVN